MISADQRIHGRWGAHLEMNVRRANVGATWQQYQWHQAVTYQLSPRVQLAVAYIWMRSYPYGNFPAAATSIEHRLHQQLIIRAGQWKRLSFEHRGRFDQRWLPRYENRVRYQLRVTVPITPRIFLLAADETLHTLPPRRTRLFVQNRAIAGVGIRFTTAARVEFQCLHQFLHQRIAPVDESNHTLRIQFVTNQFQFWRSSSP